MGGGGVGALRAPRRRNDNCETLLSLLWYRVNFGAEAAEFVSQGAKSGPESRKKISFKKKKNVIN